MPLPLIGITADLETLASGRLAAMCAVAYIDAVHSAGGVPLVLPPVPDLAAEHARLCDAFVFTGGNDPAMEAFGKPTHPAATLVHPRRQQYETLLLTALRDQEPGRPVLGICLGMQMMALHAGGNMNQHLPDTLASHAMHKNAQHTVNASHAAAARWLPAIADGEPARSPVQSNHHQAVSDAGSLLVIARSEDGVIEAVGDPGRPFYLGVQWHPERTGAPGLGSRLFETLVKAVVG